MAKFHRIKIQPLILSAIISGICMGTSYIPFPPWALLFCFVPLMNAWLKEPSAKKVFIAGWVCQFVFTLIGFNWVAYTVSEFGRMPIPVALLALIGFCSFANLHIPIAGFIWHKLFSKSSSSTLRIVSLVATIAISERLYPMIFDWNMGYPWLWANLPAYHLADLFGFFGLSTTTFFLQGLVLYFWVHRTKLRRFEGLGYAVVIFAILNIVGYFHAPNFEESKIKRVAIIQANIGNLEKQMAHKGLGFRQSILDSYLQLSRNESIYSPDFYVWPETAFPDVMTRERLHGRYGQQVLDFLNEVSGTLIMGSYGQSERGRVTNSVMFLGPEGFLAEPYHKTHLLAFGEYFPFGDTFPKLKSLVPQVSDFDRGSGPSVAAVKDLKMGAQICYEGLFDRFTRELALKDAQIIINVTNDSWFGHWQEPFQHLYMTLGRAIEVRRPLVRSTNTGITTVITAEGKVLTESPVHEAWSHTFEVPVLENPPSTVFMGFGYWVFPILLIILFLGSFILSRRKI